MAQARREPRFVDMEVLAPQPASRMPTRAPDLSDVSDAVFETLAPQAAMAQDPPPAQPRAQGAGLPAGIDLLKQNVPFDAVAYSDESPLSAGFVAFTVLAALGVFWLCGGHALLY